MNLVSSSHFFPRENQLRNEIRCLSFLITVHIVTAFWLNQEQTVQLRKYDRMQWKYPQAVTECSESTHSQWQNAVKVPISRAHGPWVPVVQWTCYQCQYFDSARVVMASYSNWWIVFFTSAFKAVVPFVELKKRSKSVQRDSTLLTSLHVHAPSYVWSTLIHSWIQSELGWHAQAVGLFIGSH